MILSPEHNPYRSGHDVPLDPDALRQSDMHQVVLLMLSWVQPNSNHQKMKKELRELLDQPVPESQRRMAAFLAKGSGTVFRQPAARDRFAQHIVWSLHGKTRQQFMLEICSSPFCATTVFPPKEEAQLETEGGIPMKIRVDALPDDAEWMRKAAKSLKEAGFDQEELDALRRNPREACLKTEGEKGVGFFGNGQWVQGTFGLWYVGRKKNRGSRRYSVACQNGAGDYCDGEPCRKLTWEWLVENGLTGAFVNGDMNPASCNLVLHKKNCFEHEGLIWIPMGVKTTFQDAYGAWRYDHAADKGSARLL